MSDAPFMQFWTGDFLGDTLHLTPKEVGQYVLLLMAMWRNGGTLPGDRKKLARIARGAISEAVMAYFDSDEEGIYQKRLRSEYEKATKKHSARVLCGKAGGEAKALKNKEPAVAKATVSLKHSSEPESESESERKKDSSASRSKPRRRLAPDFEPSTEDSEQLFSEGFSLSEIEAQIPRFRDYWIGRGQPMAEWGNTFRNWVRKSAEMGARAQGPPRVNVKLSPLMEAGKDLIEEFTNRDANTVIDFKPNKQIAG
jgi:uncharacterized protein YdaU (DUF1376 family)